MWDKNRPSRIIPKAEVYTSGDVTVSGLTISRFEGGKVVEEWTTWDTFGMLVQLGAIPEPARA